MCELLGLSFNQPVTIDISFPAFRDRGKSNPDGWGMAWFGRDGLLRLVKEPIPSYQSQIAMDLPYYSTVKSDIFISHVRMASYGGVNYLNTHPFYRQLNGETWVLAHNGTVGQVGVSENTRFAPLGDTDTELFFCRLLDWISEQPQTSGKDFNYGLASKLKSLNRHGTINALFSNGKRLYAYHDANGYNQLWCLKRKPPFPITRLRDNDLDIDLGDKKNLSEEGWIVATRPLTTENWNRVKPGELMVFNSGKRCFQQEGIG
jgi:predicted glutamine amidotransferase